MKTEAYKEAQKRYDTKKTKFYGVKLNIEADADLIKALDASDNRQGLIKKAIRSYLALKDYIAKVAAHVQ